MVSVLPGYEDVAMDVITTVGSIVSGVLLVTVGMFSLASIWFDDLL